MSYKVWLPNLTDYIRKNSRKTAGQSYENSLFLKFRAFYRTTQGACIFWYVTWYKISRISITKMRNDDSLPINDNMANWWCSSRNCLFGAVKSSTDTERQWVVWLKYLYILSANIWNIWKAQWEHSYLTLWFAGSCVAPTTNKYFDLNATLMRRLITKNCILECPKLKIYNGMYRNVSF